MQPSGIEVLGAILQPIEEKLMGVDRMNIAQRLALTHAHQHLYEAMYWLQAAETAASRIITR